ASGRSVPVSRGELIEIGGSYRLPDLMAASGARLVEVGTTNRTRAADYERAMDDTTGLLLKVHPSNYRISGFTQAAPIARLAELAAGRDLPLVFDAGSGLLDERAPWLDGPPPQWLAGEPGVVQSLTAGANLVLFSGDKLLGGPQAGIVVGGAELVETMAAHPVARALRLDGPSLAALAVTLEAYAEGTAARLPLWQMAGLDTQHLRERTERLLAASGLDGRVEDGSSTVGAGSVPGAELPGPVLVVSGAGDAPWLRLLRAAPPVVARREAGDLVVDLRTVPPAQDGHLAEALVRACRS
ncbi:MAG: L-seryl-tRNA(Sec) selenium transferase, partial [Acidimicrobiia bacterium]